MKTRRNFITRLGGLAALVALAPGRNLSAADRGASLPSQGKEPGKFYHVVFFWLVNDEEETRKKFLEAVWKLIDSVDVIRTKHVGSPADTARDVIDSSYSFSLILTFDSKKDQDLYQVHPSHDVFRGQSALWKKVLVYDSFEL